ncbi:hypothetical protein [Leuconostoc citreum]|uniref:hypothetical protein n=1 Tax=Leuconostoc citreum TaxID=33964 RepID=UPI0032DF3911
MKRQQLSLLSRSEIADISKEKPCVILVRAYYDDHVSKDKIYASVNLNEAKTKVKGRLFKDRFGYYYVGCALIQKPKNTVLNKTIPVYRTEETLTSKLQNDVSQIKTILKQKRSYYYAN